MVRRRKVRLAYYCREMKAWGLHPARKPYAHPYLASAVLVLAPEGKGYCYIRFAEKFVEAVGRALPWGVGPEHPAHLKVLYRASTDTWLIYAKYLDSHYYTTLLWEQNAKPKWLGHRR